MNSASQTKPVALTAEEAIMQTELTLKPLTAVEIEAVSGGVLLLYWLLTRPAY